MKKLIFLAPLLSLTSNTPFVESEIKDINNHNLSISSEEGDYFYQRENGKFVLTVEATPKKHYQKGSLERDSPDRHISTPEEHHLYKRHNGN
jgi:hypothetical protein